MVTGVLPSLLPLLAFPFYLAWGSACQLFSFLCSSSFIGFRGLPLPRFPLVCLRPYNYRTPLPGRMVALLPQEESMEDGMQLAPPGLNAIVLPFADEVREAKATVEEGDIKPEG